MINKQETFPTQQFIEIESIKNDSVKLKNGGLRKILLVSGVNFDLKSEEEQGLIIYAFQGFLNSLDFSVQFFIHSRKLNIENYIQKLETQEKLETNELLRNQIIEYREFINSFVSQNAIMEKNFFIVVSYNPTQMPKMGISIIDKAKNILTGRESSDIPAQTPFEEQMEQLTQRVDHVTNGLNQIGLRAVPLNDEELKELFYNLYNPETVEKKDLPETH